jgi:hypothetical protein
MLYDHRVAIAIRCNPGSGRPSAGALGSGKKIQAIKLYRELTDADLKTAKNVIDGL